MTTKNGKDTAFWAKFKPPLLPEQAKLDAVVKKLEKMSPREIVQKSVATGIHVAVGKGLTKPYLPPGSKKVTQY